MSAKETPEVLLAIPQDIVIEDANFLLVKSQRDGKSAVYKGVDSYLRIGNPEKIHSDLRLHKRMESAGFPVAKLISEGELDGKAYFIETSVGQETLSSIFAHETEVTGVVSKESFDKFLDITHQFALAQLRTQTPDRDFEEFAEGIHLDILCQELPQYAEKIQEKLKAIQERTTTLPFVISHGDYNPHNLYAQGIVDLEDSYRAPFGHDLIGGIVSIDYFPDSQEYEYFAKYRFSKQQKKEYLMVLDEVCDEQGLPRLSDFQLDFEFTRAVWLLVRMHKWPKIQQFRYNLFLDKFFGDQE